MKPKDIVTLASYLSDNNTLARAGGVEYISSLVEIIPNSANVGYYAGIIKEKSTLRQLIHLSADMTEMCYEQVDDIRDVVETAEKRIFELAEDKLKADVLAIGEHMHRTFEVLEKLYHRKEETTGVPSGFRDLDELTNGFQRSDLIIVAGRPGMGKTAFTLNLAMLFISPLFDIFGNSGKQNRKTFRHITEPLAFGCFGYKLSEIFYCFSLVPLLSCIEIPQQVERFGIACGVRIVLYKEMQPAYGGSFLIDAEVELCHV